MSRRRFLTASLAGVLVLPVLQACSQPAAAPASKPTAAAPTAPAAKPTEPAKPAATQPPAKPTEPAKPTTGGPLPKTKSGYPERAITIIVPYAAGGGTDIMFRTMDKVAAELKIFPQNFVITNVTGGSGFTGKQQAISRPPDGYTLTVADDSSIFGQILGQAPMKYTDFTYIARMVLDYNMVIVRQDSPFKSLQDWIATAKAHKYQQVNGYLNSADFQKFVDEYYAETERAFQELESLKMR